MGEHHKLVRDRIPEICEADGQSVYSRILDDEEYLRELMRKLTEEVGEVDANPCIEELGDVMEVINAIAKVLGHTPEDVEKVRLQKAAVRGGFDSKIYLIRTEPKT